MDLTYLGRKRVSVDRVLRTEFIMQTVMDVDFLELILVREWPTGDVNVVPCVVFDGEDHAVAGVTDRTTHLHKENAQIHVECSGRVMDVRGVDEEWHTVMYEGGPIST